MSAKVAFLSREVKKDEERSRTAINPKALVAIGSGKGVFVVKGKKVLLTAVTIGPPLGDMVEITGGVAAGDKVVINPPKALKNNDRIKVTES